MNQSGLLDDLSRLSSQSQNAAILKVKAEEIPTGSAYSPGILEFVNYHLSSLIVFENVKKIDGSFSYLWDFYKVSSLVSPVSTKIWMQTEGFPPQVGYFLDLSALSGHCFHKRWRNFISAQL